ncbi:MAG: hypothetical protein ACK4E8_05030 [Lacibacter sp.]|jgi:hypothetical protein
MVRFLIFSCLLLLSRWVAAQGLAAFDTVKVAVPMNRVLWHENLDKEQKRTDKLDGKIDNFIRLSANEDLNLQITDAFLRRIDELQYQVERAGTDHNFKIGYLRGLRELLQDYNQRVRTQKEVVPLAPVLLQSFEACMERMAANQPIEPVFRRLPYLAGEILAPLFIQSKEIAGIKAAIYLKKCAFDAKAILKELPVYADAVPVDSLLSVAAIKVPLDVYTYAQAIRTEQSKLIRQSKDPRVQTIVRLSEISNGTLFLPFLDELVRGNISMEEVRAIAGNDLQYYRLLVKTQIRYHERMIAGDTPLLANTLADMLQRKATDVFVNVMNDLHDSPEAVRFRIAEPLTPQEIYYLIVTTEDVIYTSTYTNLYKRMMERTPGRRSDSLLMSVHLDRFKKFIKMAANYNRLDDFLNAMPELRSNQLMYAFINGLQKTNSLEDAVDVADSYGSIQNPRLKNFLKEEARRNIEKSIQNNDRRGESIYSILHTLFRSSEDSTINLTAALGIPPVYRVDYNSIADEKGQVVQQVFFYGDEDGVISFRNFMSMFTNKPEWKVQMGKEWVTITSTQGKPYTIYANLPLDYKKDLDQKAQENLIAYLTENNINPTIVVHRGHSYHLPHTLKQMMPSSRIVMLGSCGGYQNLAKILNVNEDAHIISTKQVGSYSVNEPILRTLNEAVRNGRNIEWIPLWQQITSSVRNDPKASELIKDYVPPHKNLGAIFIKAYRRRTGES